MPKKYGITKSEIIKDEKVIKKLLTNKNKIFVFPILAKWETVSEYTQPSKVAFIVSKKRFSKATDRNLLKRRIRESYRKHKHAFQNVNKNLHLQIIFIYVSNSIENYSSINNAIKSIIYLLYLKYQGKNY